MEKSKDEFKIISKEEELSILLNDDENFTNTEGYLKGLIYKIMGKYNLNKKDEGEIYKKVVEALRTAANIYITKKHYEKGYKFSTYFTWWVKEAIEKETKDSQKPS